MSSRSRRPLYAALALTLLLGALPVAAGPLPAEMSVDDVIALLKAGVGEKVILGHARATGTRLALTVEEILRLKSAGASDDLLAALVNSVSGGSAATASQTPHSFRVYREVNDKGEEVLHITNLDAAGRRIGGEVERKDPPAQQVQESSQADRPAPVIVNVYPPEPTGSEEIYQGYRVGFGFHGHRPRAGAHHPPRQGFEPGLFSRPATIDTRPYRQKSAAQRNRIRFGDR